MAGIEGVDVVAGGDSHTLLGAEEAPVFMTRGEYRVVTTTSRQSDGRTLCVVHAWEYGHLLGPLKMPGTGRGDGQWRCRGTGRWRCQWRRRGTGRL
jgi:5'-nucleotidase/UDP-sugar diphosphatase